MRKRIMLPLTLIMMIIMMVLIYFVRKMMKNITICAQAVMRILLPTLSKHANIWFVPTVSISMSSHPKFTEVSLNSRSAEQTGDTENGCATWGGQSHAPRAIDCGGINHASGRRGRGQQIDWSNSWSTENSRWFDLSNGWFMEVSAYLSHQKYSTQIVLKIAKTIKFTLFLW